jgi:hypothetical protein
MNKLFILIFAALAFVGCQSKKEPVLVYNNYGEVISAEDALTLASLTEKLADNDSIALTLKGTIEKTCEKKGCWMTVTDENGAVTRVTFKDYGFFVPTEGAEGKDVVFEGIAKRKITDVATLRHFAEDEGKSQEEIDAITEPKEEIEFVASGVVIYEKESKQ